MLPQFQTILYATGLGAHAPKVFRYAMTLAMQHGAKIVIVHALEPLSSTAKSLVESYVSEDVMESLREEGFQRVVDTVKTRLERFCEEECASEPRCRECVSEIRILEGRPADVILKEAERINADLIVMGSHAHTAVGEILLGTTAHRVVQHATVPVLLVRAGKE